MFVDASALVAMLTRESGWEALSTRLARAEPRLTSGLALYEATLAIARKDVVSVPQAQGDVEQFLRSWKITTVEIGLVHARLAVDAHARYGKGNHAAKLNMGDCFAYACAKQAGVELLYKGHDFAQTDLA